jgi:hypothetical protein
LAKQMRLSARVVGAASQANSPTLHRRFELLSAPDTGTVDFLIRHALEVLDRLSSSRSGI